MEISFDNLRLAEHLLEELDELRDRIVERITLSVQVTDNTQSPISGNSIMRICLLAGLSQKGERDMDAVRAIKNSSNRIFSGSFNQERSLFSALLKLRYNAYGVDWKDNILLSHILSYEMRRGCVYLLQGDHLEALLHAVPSHSTFGEIPKLNLVVGNYNGDMDAVIDINSRSISNSQILVAGATGSGKTNLLMALMSQFRALSVETRYPVNFLLFDYKGEYSDPANAQWLRLLEVNRSAILDPMGKSIPVTPFKDFTNQPVNEINLYSTEMATAFCSLDRTNISANMSNRLSEAIIACYRKTHGAPITFQTLLEEYRRQLGDNDKEDSITSVLNQLVRSHIFADKDQIDLVNGSYIVKLDRFPQNGPLAKAIVYFLMSKMNNIYERLEKQAMSDERIQIRHFSIIDEAHHMLSFDNAPLRRLIAEGRNKGLSIILATQNMADFKSDYFDFYANAQYPLIMKQQTIADGVLKDLFGVNGNEFKELKEAISGLQKGEVILKNQDAFTLGFGKKWKKFMANRVV